MGISVNTRSASRPNRVRVGKSYPRISTSTGVLKLNSAGREKSALICGKSDSLLRNSAINASSRCAKTLSPRMPPQIRPGNAAKYCAQRASALSPSSDSISLSTTEITPVCSPWSDDEISVLSTPTVAEIAPTSAVAITRDSMSARVSSVVSRGVPTGRATSTLNSP